MAATRGPRRLAFVVSHPIQYYVPLYQRLAARDDVKIKVFYTWHAGEAPVRDHGFRQPIAWDIPLAEGYEHELVPNTAREPGTHRFLGLRNPDLARRVLAWSPHAVHLTGWGWLSHVLLLRRLHNERVPVLFRGDSRLPDDGIASIGERARSALRRHVFRWPARFLYVGVANRSYYEFHGVQPARLCHCPHSIDAARFAEPAERYEAEALAWRERLGIGPGRVALLYAGKFEPVKRPLDLMRAVGALADPRFLLIMVGAGQLEGEVRDLAARDPARFRVLPFQNQSEMPLVYRLADMFVLPSASETWGLAVNEALACGRPVLVSDRVGCAPDVVDDSCGRVFLWNDWNAMVRLAEGLAAHPAALHGMRAAAHNQARRFDIPVTEETLMACLPSALAP